jgi:DNA-binding transcriptional ArsR family regulator
LKHAMPKPRQRLSEEVIELIASRFRALGEASRLKLIIAVEAGEKNVSQLAATTDLSQPNVSKHLQFGFHLDDARFAKTRWRLRFHARVSRSLVKK